MRSMPVDEAAQRCVSQAGMFGMKRKDIKFMMQSASVVFCRVCRYAKQVAQLGRNTSPKKSFSGVFGLKSYRYDPRGAKWPIVDSAVWSTLAAMASARRRCISRPTGSVRIGALTPLRNLPVSHNSEYWTECDRSSTTALAQHGTATKKRSHLNASMRSREAVAIAVALHRCKGREGVD